MKRNPAAILGVPVLISASLLFTQATTHRGKTMPAAATTRARAARAPEAARLVANYDRMPLRFEQNQGQSDSQVKFVARGTGYAAFLTADGAVLELGDDAGSLNSSQTGPARDVVRMRLVGMNPGATAVGLEPMAGSTNYFIGNDPSKWRAGASSYARVEYRNIYPGIDLVYYGRQGRLEYDLVVHPGANPKSVQLALAGMYESRSGSKQLRSRLESNGDLVLRNARGEIRFHKPVAYQAAGNGKDAGVRRQVQSRFTIKGSEVSFEVTSYDPRKTLVIDPSLGYSSYLGGNSTDEGFGIAVDSAGNAYVTGTTMSSNFPTSSPAQGTYGGSKDLFVTKVNSNGTMGYSTYLGGTSSDNNQFEFGNGIAVDGSGNVYLIGNTSSNNFPTKNAIQSTYRGASDGFAVKLNADGTLGYSTYLGGSRVDGTVGLAVDSAGAAYIVGNTASANFPVSATPFQSTFGGGFTTLFVTKINTDGTMAYSTYLGGSDEDDPFAIAVDGAGHAYVAGDTFSTDFPLHSAVQATSNGGYGDGFISELSADGSSLVYSTFLGGSGSDTNFTVVNGIAVDGSGNTYVTGNTGSGNFPTAAAFQGTIGAGGSNAFVTKLSPGGLSLVYSSFLGGSVSDIGYGIAVDAGGEAFVSGQTSSPDFPTLNAFQSTYGGGVEDLFVTKVNADGTLGYSTYLGGSGDDQNTQTNYNKSIVLDSNGAAYVWGQTNSSDFPTANGVQAGYGGGFDGFITKFNIDGTVGYSTYLGGSSDDGVFDLAVDSAGNAYVTGYTKSANFPTNQPFQATNGGGTDAIVAKIAGVAQFSSLTAKLAAQVGPPGSFQLNASFMPSAAIDPIDNPVSSQVGPYSVTIPAGSFQQLKNGSKAGSWVYSGTIDGASLSIQIDVPGKHSTSYDFKVSAQSVNLTGISAPVPVTITIGNNTGSTLVTNVTIN